MGYVIDTNIFVGIERGRLTNNALFAQHEEEPAVLSVITAAELLHGVHRAKDPAIRHKRSAFVEAILTKIPVQPFDLKTARHYAELSAWFSEQSRHIGAHDLMIAATAISLGFAVLTADRKDFEKIPGLKVTQA